MKNLLYTALITGLIMNISTKNSLAGHPELANLGQIKFSAPQVARYTLDNGLVVYAVKDNTLPVVHVSALVRTGSARDPEGKTGLAQMAVSLLRDGGTARHKAEELDKTLEYLGAQLETSAYTEDSRADMTALTKDFAKVLDLYAEVLLDPAFEEEKVKIARDEALELIRRRNDSPPKTAIREAKRMFFGKDHPYGRRAEEATINAVTREDMAAFHAAYFRPNNTILAVSGDFSSYEDLLALLKEKFGGWKSAAVPRQAVPPPAYRDGRRLYLIDKDVPQAFIVVLQPGAARTSPENFRLSVLTDILGGGFQSRLFSEVRTKRGLAYDVGSASVNLNESGFLASTCGTKSETYSQALAEILRQFGRIGGEAVQAEELDRSKGSIINPFVFKFSTPHKLALQRAQEEFYGYTKGYLDTYVARVSEVTAGAVLDAGRKYLAPENALIVVIGDARKFDKPLSEFGQVTELKED